MILRLLATFLLLLAGLSAPVVLSATAVDVAAAIAIATATAEKALLESEVVLSSLDNLDNEATVILEENAAFESVYGDQDAQTKEVEQLVRDVNAKQLQVLVNKLEEVRDKERKRRHREDIINGAGVTLSELKELFKPETVLAESEAKVEEFVLGIVEEEMLALKKDFEAASAPDAPDNCVTTEQALNVVQEALLNHSRDVIGIPDHARGATILHEFTSETYTPPPDPSQLLGRVWWRKYIPEDWERVLPEGWENWNVGLAPSLFHTLGKGGATAPPETILHPNVLPGSCWPMQGQRGKVMVSLPYPVQVTAITLDHVSHHLLMDKKEQLKSAPKHVQIFGYPPCRGACAGLTFDSSKKYLLAEIEYDIEKPSIQTFPVEDGGAAIAGGSCTATVEAAACDAGPGSPQDEDTEGLYSAIQLEVVNNWGNEAYTCLYRVRVHGDPEI